MKYFLLDELSKIDPVTGKVDTGETAENSLELHAAGNEFAAFQIVLVPEKNECATNVCINAEIAGIKTITKLYRECFIPVGRKFYPDPLVPVAIGEKFKLEATCTNIPSQKYFPFWLDFFIPKGTRSGNHSIKLTVKYNGKELQPISIPLQVLPFSLPDRPSFTMEFNNYGGLNTSVIKRTREESIEFQGTPEYERQLYNYHLLSREHWGVLNVLGYGQNGTYSPGMAPVLKSHAFTANSFKDYDKRFGPFLDGTAFKTGYGKGVPVSDFYLPFSFTWPAPWNYFPSEEYLTLIAEGVREFEKHIRLMKWNRTKFHIMLNHKSRRSIFPYNGDEPTRIKDYGMLKYYLGGVNSGLSKNSPLHFRLDVGHYECSHIMDECDQTADEKQCVHSSALDGLSDFWVTSLSHGSKESLEKRRRKGETVWIYQGASTIGRPLSDQAQVLLEVYRRSAAGYCFWSCNSWTEAPWNDCGKRMGFDYLFYPGKNAGINEPLPSMRLKAARRTAMDIEYIEIAKKTGKAGTITKRLNNFVKHFASNKIDFMDDTISKIDNIDFLKKDSWKSFRQDLLKITSNVKPE